jgi:hypothetical protein
MYFEKTFLPLLYLDMHNGFQLKKLFMYQLILNVSRNIWHITIGASLQFDVLGYSCIECHMRTQVMC